MMQDGNCRPVTKPVWLITTWLHHVAWQSVDQLVMLGGNLRAVISNVIANQEPWIWLLKNYLTITVCFPQQLLVEKPPSPKQKPKIFFNFHSDANEIFSNLPTVMSFWKLRLKDKMFIIGIKNYERLLSSSLLYFLSHMGTLLFCSVLLPSLPKKKHFVKERKQKNDQNHIWSGRQTSWRQMSFTLVSVRCLTIVLCAVMQPMNNNYCSMVAKSTWSEKFPQESKNNFSPTSEISW